MKNNSLRFRNKKLNLVEYLIVSMFESIRINIYFEFKKVLIDKKSKLFKKLLN